MPHEIQLGFKPAGYTQQSAKKGDVVDLVYREFTSSEDGNLFISRLEGIPRQLLAAIPGATIADESCVSHMLAIVRPDETATLYVNDLPHSVEIRAKGAGKAGQAVSLDDIMDVSRIRLKGIVIPEDAGLVAIFSVGWRKGLFFDFEPLQGVRRNYDIETALGHCYSYVAFQHLFAISDPIWNEIIRQKWFPFIALKQTTIKQMISLAGSGFSIDDLLETISAEATAMIATQIESWSSHSLLAEHYPFLKTAFERFQAEDYISSSSILFPRIEGILRTHHIAAGAISKANQRNLAAGISGPSALRPHSNSLLLPSRFQRFLEQVYFADFDPKKPKGLSRNTVSHGVAPASALDKKGSILAFLILLQIVALLPRQHASTSTPSSVPP